MKFGKKHPYMTLFQNQPWATKIFKTAAIFKMAAKSSLIVPVLEVDG